jgi:hypothetical protein
VRIKKKSAIDHFLALKETMNKNDIQPAPTQVRLGSSWGTGLMDQWIGGWSALSKNY